MNPNMILDSLMDEATDHIHLSRCEITVSSSESTAQVHMRKFIVCPKLLSSILKFHSEDGEMENYDTIWKG